MCAKGLSADMLPEGAAELQVRCLGPGDEEALDAFLARHADTTLFPRSNLRRGGIVDRGATYQASYVGAFDGGRMVGMVGHGWNGNLHLQAPPGLIVDLARVALAASGRPLCGLLGPWSQVETVDRALAPGDPVLRSVEPLFSLTLADLVVPPALAAGRLSCRSLAASDLPLLTGWRAEYRVAVGMSATDLPRKAREDMERVLASGDGFVLEAAGRPVATCTFNARVPDMVQIGGVWTPPAERGQGYARAVVAGALREAARQGIGRAVLFTDEANHAAQAAYRALGFQQRDLFGVILYRD